MVQQVLILGPLRPTGDNFQCLKTLLVVTTKGGLLASSRHRPGTLLNIIQSRTPDRGTQELKIFTVVIVDRRKWLMQWKLLFQEFDLMDSRRSASDSTFVCSREADKELLIRRLKIIPGKSPLDCNSYLINFFSKPLTNPFLLLI